MAGAPALPPMAHTPQFEPFTPTGHPYMPPASSDAADIRSPRTRPSPLATTHLPQSAQGMTCPAWSQEPITSPETSYTSSIGSSGGLEKGFAEESRRSKKPEQSGGRPSHERSVNRSPRTPRDPEKQRRSQAVMSRPQSTTIYADTDAYIEDNLDEEDPEAHTLSILLYLSGPCCAFSFLILFWTMFSLFAVALLQPLRLCTTRRTFSNQLNTFLSPPLDLHLGFIYSAARWETSNASSLVMIHVLSPFISMGVALAAWVAACFWFFAAIIGDPGGKDGHNDGKATVLGVRRWWERWLMRGLG